MIRSFLFCPADDAKKMEKAAASNADAVIFDLEDSVAPNRKEAARAVLSEFLSSHHQNKTFWIRINPLHTGLADEDVSVAASRHISGVILPKCNDANDVKIAANMLALAEKETGLTPDSLRIIPVATETPRAVFEIDKIAAASRIWGLTWGAEDLAAAVGASANKDASGRLRPIFEHARTVCLLAARAATVEPIDTASMIMDDDDALREECLSARFDGFSGKLAIHPKQIEIIHDAFTPSEDEVAAAREIAEAFAENPGVSVFRLRGRMIDTPHLKTAERTLSLAAAATKSLKK